jgi:Thymidylate synthase complementing protein
MPQLAELLAHSVGPFNKPLISFRVKYPKFIHGETLTHRLLESQPELVAQVPDGLMYDHDMSRNASSSRATPVKKMIEAVMREPVVPSYWGKNQAGMQAREELSPSDKGQAIQMWFEARDDAVRNAQRLADLGAHKQIVNRILEPWMHIVVVITATEWNNFFALRRHADAQPEIKDLADKMFALLEGSTPNRLAPNQWHLPFITEDDYIEVTQHIRFTLGVEFGQPELIKEMLRKISAARCARTSYYNFDGVASKIKDDLGLFDKLVVRDTVHASPLEHQATPDVPIFLAYDQINEKPVPMGWQNANEHGNLKEWRQFRRMIPNHDVPG